MSNISGVAVYGAYLKGTDTADGKLKYLLYTDLKQSNFRKVSDVNKVSVFFMIDSIIVVMLLNATIMNISQSAS